jgi:hypothetical protein
MRVFVVPKEGVLIRHPKTKVILPAEGFFVVLQGKEGKYWQRRINCGDVVIKNNKEE